MKDDKIVIGQLKSLLAKKAKISERQAAQFVEALFQQISVGLQQDGQVKISGLGTFKIQWNEPRKSVDVNTGNEIVIDGYNKVTFSPEASIKTLVNEPYANLEPQIIDENGNPIEQPKNDPLQKLSDEADNIMLLIADLKKMDNQQNTNEQQEEPKQEKEKQEEPKQEEPKQEEPKQEEPKQEEPKQEEPKQEETEQEEPKQEEPKQEEPKQEEGKQDKDTENIIPPEVKPAKKTRNKKRLVVEIIIATILLLAVVGYFVFQAEIDSFVKNKIEQYKATYSEATQEEAQEETKAEENQLIVDTTTIDTISANSADTVEKVLISEGTAQPIEDEDTVFIEPNESDFPAKQDVRYDTIKHGVTLAALARKYYNGQSDFWVFIYEANRDQLTAPNSARLGMKLIIPYIDADSPERQQEAKEKVQQYKTKK